MLSSADPPFLYAVAGVVILAVASLFGLVLFASREETFEDVVEKQRKAQEALLNSLQTGGSSGKSSKQNRKKKNKKASKAKGQEVQEIDSGVDDDDEITTEPAVVTEQPPVEEAPAPAPSKKKKKKKNKAQVQQPEPVVEVPVEEPVPIVEESSEPIEEELEEVVEQVEEEEVQVAPEPEDVSEEEAEVEVEVDVEEIQEDELDEPEADAEVEDEDEEDEDDPEQEQEQEETEEPVIEEPEPVAEVEEEPEVQEEVEAVQDVVEEPVPEPEPEVPEPVHVPAPTIPAPVSEKIKPSKKKSGKKNTGGGNKSNPLEKFQNELMNSDLNSEDVEKLMDMLLAKQKELDEWKTPGKKSTLNEQLKSKIDELQQLFEEERKNASAIGSKLKDAKLELQQERNARQSIQNEATNRINQKVQEAEAIRKHMEEKHISEMHSLQSQISRMQVIIDDNSTNHMELQRLKEENAHLKNASMMAQQLAEDKQSLMTELSQLQQTNKALRQEFDNLIIHHQQEMQNIQIAKVDSEGALSQRLQEMNEQLLKVESQNRSLHMEMSEHQHQQMISETYQMATSPTEGSTLVDLQNEIKLLRNQLEEKDGDKEAELVGDEMASLVEMIAEKDQCITQLEQKIAMLERIESNDSSTGSGQQSPDLVVVTPSDLLGSEPVLANESFEEVSVDKETVEDVVVPEVESTLETPSTSDPDVVEEIAEAVDLGMDESVPEIGGTQEQEKIESLKSTISQHEATISEYESTISKHETTISEYMVAVSEHEAAIAVKEAEINSLQTKILETPAAAPANDSDEGSVAEYLLKISELEEALSQGQANENVADYLTTIQELEENLKAKELELLEASKTSGDGESSEELTNKLKEVKEELQARTDATDELKQKNNELREKNWKVIDALAKAEQLNTENAKNTDIAVKKGLKKLFPDLSLPKIENDIDQLFTEFTVVVNESLAEAGKDGEPEKLKALEEEIVELKKMNELMNASQDEMLKSQEEKTQLVEENAHIKNVLIETESMLCRLQTGVDAEVQKWQKKVTEKDEELDKTKKNHEEITEVLSKNGYDIADITKLDSSLSNGQKQLMAEKEEVTRMKAELAEAEKKLEELKNGAVKATNEEVTELNTKLKKTISERDLLIREYKNVKDNNSKVEAELKETKETVEKMTLEKSQTSGVDLEKDAMIKKLTLEIEELREKLQEERDCVIVDIDPDNADNLHKQVEVLSTELQSEKQRILELEAKQSKDVESRSGTSV